MDAPRFTLICCSVDPAAAEALRRNVAATIGEPFEFDVWDNRGRNVGLCDVYDRCAERSGGEYLCFVHEDVRFLTEGWGARLAAKLCEPDCGVIGFAGSVLKLRRTTAWLHGVGDMRANYVQYHGGGRHLHAKNPGGTDFSPVVTLDGMCLVVRRDVWAATPFDGRTFPGFHCYDLDFTTAVFAAGRRNYVCNTVLVEHFSAGALLLRLARSARNLPPQMGRPAAARRRTARRGPAGRSRPPCRGLFPETALPETALRRLPLPADRALHPRLSRPCRLMGAAVQVSEISSQIARSSWLIPPVRSYASSFPSIGS